MQCNAVLRAMLEHCHIFWQVFCSIVAFVCLLSELRALRELLEAALSCIAHVVAIWRDSCDTVALGGVKINKSGISGGGPWLLKIPY